MGPPNKNRQSQSLERLRRDAEREMRRNLDDVRPVKRSRQGEQGGQQRQGEAPSGFVAVDRYRYAVMEELEAGAKGFLITCNFRKEKSATREATQLLRRYLPDHLFPQQQQQERPLEQQAPLEQQQQQQEDRSGPQGPPGLTAAEGRGSPPAVEREETAAAAPSVRGGRGEEEGADGGDDEDGDREGDSDQEEDGEGDGADGDNAGAASREPSALALAKVGCRGVVLMRLSAAAAAEVDPVRVVEAMLGDREAGLLRPPVHCQRITPLDSTCGLTPAGLTRAVAQAAAAHVQRCRDGAAQDSGASAAAAAVSGASAAVTTTVEPFTYAVVYHSRLTEPTSGTAAPAAAPGAAAAAAAAGPPAAGSGAGGDGVVSAGAGAASAGAGAGPQGEGQVEEEGLMDRGRIIFTVAGGMAAAFGSTATVHLKKPQVAVLVEALAVAGRPLAGLTVLRGHMFTAKGKLLVKPLADTAAKQ